MRDEDYIPFDEDRDPDPADNSLAAEVARAKAVLKPHVWPNRRVLKSALHEWFPDSVDNEETMWEMANALLVNVDDDVDRFDSGRVAQIYSNLCDNVSRFGKGAEMSAEDYLEMLGIDPTEVAEVTRCWQRVLNAAGTEDAESSLSMSTVYRLDWYVDRGETELSMTDLVYLLIRPYAEAITSGKGITSAVMSRALDFTTCLALLCDGRRISPLILMEAKARIDLVHYKDLVDASYYHLDQLLRLPIKPECISMLIDRLGPGPETTTERWLKLRLDPEHPNNLPDFMINLGIYDKSLEELCVLAATVLARKEAVRAELLSLIDQRLQDLE